MNKKRVLLITASSIKRDGVLSFLEKWISQAQEHLYSFTLYHPCRCVDESFADQFKEKGVTLICGGLDQDVKRIKKFIKINIDVKKILERNDFDIIHVNTGSSAIVALTLRQAKKRNVSVRIGHSHGARPFSGNKLKTLIISFFQAIINQCATKKVACSVNAAEALFGVNRAQDAIIVKNAIKTDKFAFSPENRAIKRRELGLEGCFVIGQIARLSPEKNQRFLIDVFMQAYHRDSTARLLLVGDGALAEEVMEYAKQLNLEKYVIFAGTTDIPQIFYSVMDVFILPSIYEGLPIVGVEAQASGLPCVFSDAVTTEVKLTENCRFLPLNVSAQTWAEVVLSYKDIKLTRDTAWHTVRDSGYDVSTIPKMMEDIYQVDECCKGGV